MSGKGIYTALSGAIAQDQRMETIANNIANVNTPAFKRDQQVFKEYLTAAEKQPDVIQVPKVPASIESFYDMQGGDRSYVDNVGSFTDFSQGGIKPTGNPLDCAIDGKAFFEVLSPGGIRMTKNGAFKIDNEGKLVTKEGFPVLRAGTGTEDPATRVIQLKGNKVSIGADGDIYEENQNVGKLSIVSTAILDSLQKVGSSLYKFRDNITNPDINRSPNAQIHQGFLESSNVEIIKEMTDMIGATRVFDSTQRAIKAYDAMAEKLVNVVPKMD